ncbi:hypothetical protein E2C01_012625 [Portunus trituberculatus]|uniref:CCHC-type domain-containing protein n=1 Tax=Portunus trituberculatus TaxID=210409 RepID=A0A5B7DEI3_PORTR|nr:hypothetical protein [Portunus trituberculatus]
MVTVLSRDAFVDALEDQQVQIYVKQAHPADVQHALARAMEFEAFLYTTAAAVTPYHRFAAQKPPRCHLPARRRQVQQRRMRRTSSGEFNGFCWKCGKRGHRRSDCRSERMICSLEDVRARSPTKACCENCGRWGHRRAACSHMKDVMMVGESKAGWEFGPLSSQVVPGARRCQVPQRRYCVGGPSVGRSGRPPVSSGGGHWSDEDLRQGRSSGKSRFPCVRLAAVWRDWPLYGATRPRDVYHHGGWRGREATSIRGGHGGTLSARAGFPGSE